MALEPDPQLKDHIDALYEHFLPIFREWQKTSPPPAPTPIPATAEDCLHQDIFLLVRALAEADTRTYALNINLLAEVLVLLKRESIGAYPYEYYVSIMDSEIRTALGKAASPPTPGVLPELLCVRIVNAWVNADSGRKARALAMEESLLTLINDFILRDGLITREELSFLDNLGKKFAV